MFFGLWYYLLGYVIICIRGKAPEKLINICVHRNISLWNLEKISKDTIKACVLLKDFKKIRGPARKAKCRIKILEKKGIRARLLRYKRRRFLLIGPLLAIMAIIFLTSFLWTVQIIGNERVGTDVIEEELKGLGLYAGALKYEINHKKIAGQLMTAIPDIAWASVSIKGTKAVVEISEVLILPEEKDDKPCNIVAKKDAVIKSIVVKDGTAETIIGAVVKKGQILVLGSIPVIYGTEELRYVHAKAVIMGETVYEAKSNVENYITEKSFTGNEKKKTVIILFGKEIFLPWGNHDYMKYETVVMPQKPGIKDGTIFPFGYYNLIYKEYIEVKRKLEEDEAVQKAADKAAKKALEKVPDDAEIINRYVEITEGENNIKYVTAYVICIEDIGKEKVLEGVV